jgi:hypothetical protein
MTKDELIDFIVDQIALYEADLEMTTEEDFASFYQGQLEAYEECLARVRDMHV